MYMYVYMYVCMHMCTYLMKVNITERADFEKLSFELDKPMLGRIVRIVVDFGKVFVACSIHPHC